jgi:hypothetical protein
LLSALSATFTVVICFLPITRSSSARSITRSTYRCARTNWSPPKLTVQGVSYLAPLSRRSVWFERLWCPEDSSQICTVLKPLSVARS